MSKKAELISNYFPTIYLTVISLLQGIALSQLVPSLITYFNIAENPWTDIRLLPIIIMLGIIFIVWHHYAIGIFFLRWFPNIIDTIIPFMISIGQFMLIAYLTIETSVDDIQLMPWTKGLAGFWMLGSITYFAAAWRLDPMLFVNIMSRQDAHIHHALTKSLFIKAGFSILVQGMFVAIIALTGQLWMLWIALVLFLTHLVGFELILMYDVKKHYIAAMDDFEARNYKD
jgi:hypothetical protein